MSLSLARLLGIILLFCGIVAVIMPSVAQAGGQVTNCNNDVEFKSKVATGGTVTFNCGGPKTIIINGEIEVTQSVVIQGGGVITLSGNNANRVFTITNGDVTVDGLGFINGNGEAGGAIALHDITAPRNSSLIVRNSIFQNNVAGYGGAIYVVDDSESVLIEDTMMRDNSVSLDSGGAMYVINSNLTVRNTIFRNNETLATDGGALLYFSGGNRTNTLLIENSTFDDNFAQDEGGGLMLATSGTATLNATLINTTVSNNRTAVNDGGGIRAREVGGNGSVNLTIANSTISGNRTQGDGGISGQGDGGAISLSGAALTLINSTVAFNTAYNRAGGIQLEALGALLTAKNSLIAKNTTTTSPSTNGQDCFRLDGSVISNGNNLIGVQQGCTGFFNQATDQFGSVAFPLDPLLDVLADNGGQTQTHALFGGSPAIDAGDDTTCNASPISGVDQRGESRLQGTNCDVGSYEAPANQARVVTDCNGREQLQALIDLGPGTITFDCGSTTLPITNTPIIITDNQITLDGGGVMSLVGDYSTRLFQIAESSTVTFTEITLMNGGTNSAPGGAMRVADDSSIIIVDSTLTTNKGDEGGAIALKTGSDLLMRNSQMTENTAISGDGGAILVDGDNSDLSIVDSELVDNTAMVGDGGAMALVASSQEDQSLLLDNVEISDNEAVAGVGGGLYLERSGSGQINVTVQNNSLINGNRAFHEGGGVGVLIANANGAELNFDMSDSTVSQNVSSAGAGGGLGIKGGSGSTFHFDIDNVDILQNTAMLDGGGIYLDLVDTWLNDSTFTLQNGTTINQNESTNGSGGGVYITGRTSLFLVDIADTTITNNDAAGNAGGLGINSESSMRLEATIADSTFRNNSAQLSGGALYVNRMGSKYTDLELTNSLFQDNVATFNGGAMQIQSSESAGNDLTARLTELTFTGNRSTNGDGGALGLTAINPSIHDIVIEQSTFDDNEAVHTGGGGGAISILRAGTGLSTVTLNQSTLSNNRAGGDGGGGLFTSGGGANLTLEIVNSTISGNSTQNGGNGGGMRVSRGDVTLHHDTIHDNETVSLGGGVRVDGTGYVTYQQTIIAGNRATSGGPDCHYGGTVGSSGVTSVGYNVVGDKSNCGNAFTETGDQAGDSTTPLDPVLDTLADNGGTTQSHALLDGSPANNTIPGASCTLVVDQVDTVRPQGANCDSGSMEYLSPASLFVSKTAPTNLVRGQRFSYTIHVTNSGSSEATGVVLVDTLPTNLSIVSVDEGSSAGNVVTWDSFTVPGLSAVQRTLTVSTCQTAVTNANYRVTNSDQGINSDFGPPVASTLSTPDIQADFDFALFGVQVNFADTTIPPGSDIVAWLWDFGDGSSSTEATPSHNYSISGLKNVSLTVTDGCGFEDTVTQQIDVGRATVALEVIQPATTVTPGQPLTYLLTLRNTGLFSITGLVISNTVPLHTRYITGSIETTISEGQVGIPDGLLGLNVTILPGVTEYIQYSVLIDEPLTDGTQLVNTVIVTSPTLAQEDSASNLTTIESSHELSLTKRVSAESISPDGVLTYTIIYTLSGNNPATDITIQDELPAHTTYITSNGELRDGTVMWKVGEALQDSIGREGGVVTMTVQVDRPLANGTAIVNTAQMTSEQVADPTEATVTSTVQSSHRLWIKKVVTPTVIGSEEALYYTIFYTITGNAPATEVALFDKIPEFTNFVSATGDPDFSGVADGGPIVWELGRINPPHSGSIRLIVRTEADLDSGGYITNTATLDSREAQGVSASARSLVLAPRIEIEKVANTQSVIGGRAANYTIYVRNTGGVTATNIVITDTLPKQFRYLNTDSIEVLSATRTLTTNPTIGGQTLIWNRWTVQPGGFVAITFNASVPLSTPEDTYINKAEATSIETGELFFEGAAVNVAQFPELIVQKITLSPTVLAGGVATYTVSIHNNGTKAASGVVISDTLPEGFTYRTTLAIQEQAGDEGIPTIREQLINPTLGDAMPLWGSWRIPVNGALTLTYSVDVARTADEDEQINMAQASANEQLAGLAPIAQATIEVRRIPELTVHKWTTTPIVTAGAEATYIIVVQNIGTAPAILMEITDELPGEFGYLDSTVQGISATEIITNLNDIGAGELLWRVGSLAEGGAITISLNTRVPVSALDITYNNPVTVPFSYRYGTQFVDDVVAFDPFLTADDDVTVVHAPALRLSQHISPTTVSVNESLTYTLVVRNIGSANALAVTLESLLPAGLSYRETLSIAEDLALRTDFINPDGSDSQQPLWGRWLIGSTGAVTIQFLVDVATSAHEGTYMLTGTVRSDSVATISQTETVQVLRRPTLQIDKDTLTPVVVQGEQVTYQVVVQNVGIISATGVVITDILPVGGFGYRETIGLEESLATRTLEQNPTQNETRPVWGEWTIEPHGSITLTFLMDVFGFARDGLYNNTAQSNSLEGQPIDDDGTVDEDDDTIPGRDLLADDDVLVGRVPLLAVMLEAVTPDVPAGGLVTYRLTISNIGRSTANGVVITNTLPSGFTYLRTISVVEDGALRISEDNPADGTAQPVWGAWSIEGEGAVIITFIAHVGQTLPLGAYQAAAEASNLEGHAMPGRPAVDTAWVSVGPPKEYQTYLPVIFKLDENSTPIPPTPTPTDIITVTPGGTVTPATPTATPTATPSPTVTPTPTATVMQAPDLVVERIVANGSMVQVVIRNQGQEAVNKSFWVDFYVDPNPPPTQVNEVWYVDNRSTEGVVWGVNGSALPLDPQEVLVLTYSTDPNAPNAFVVPEYTNFSGAVVSGTPIYAQVDSANSTTDYGAILETHEITGQPYNNISGATLSAAGAQSFSEPQEFINVSTRQELPPRP